MPCSRGLRASRTAEPVGVTRLSVRRRGLAAFAAGRPARPVPTHGGTMHLFLVGAGHVGLVTAVGLAKLGHRVTVADIDERRIGRLSEGIPPIYEPGLE